MMSQLKLIFFFILITFSISKENIEIDANGKSAFETLLKLIENQTKTKNTQTICV